MKNKSLAKQILSKHYPIKIAEVDGTLKNIMDAMEEYAIKRVIQVKKQLTQDVIDDCNDNYSDGLHHDTNTVEFP